MVLQDFVPKLNTKALAEHIEKIFPKVMHGKPFTIEDFYKVFLLQIPKEWAVQCREEVVRSLILKELKRVLTARRHTFALTTTDGREAKYFIREFPTVREEGEVHYRFYAQIGVQNITAYLENSLMPAMKRLSLRMDFTRELQREMQQEEKLLGEIDLPAILSRVLTRNSAVEDSGQKDAP
mgnify:FL=1